MYNGVTHFRDFGSKNVPKISRGLKLEGFLLLYFIDQGRSYLYANTQLRT